MTSTPRKLNLIDHNENSMRTIHDGSTMLAAFDQLAALLASDSRFAAYKFSVMPQQSIDLSKDGISLKFFAATVWLQDSQNEIRSLLTKSETNTVIICVGSETEFSQFPEHLDGANIHQLVLPSTLRTIEFQVRGLFRSKTFHAQASEEKRSADETLQNIKHVLSISRELNGIRDVNRLLGLILTKARQVTRADAGSIYVVERGQQVDEGAIIFKISQNASVKINLSEFKMKISDRSIVGNSVIHMKTINIPDLYKLDVDPTKNPYNAQHDTSLDRRNGYECHSMLSIPMFDISHEVIGVIQLINCKVGDEQLKATKDFEERVIPFDETAVEYAEIVAHQAGIALENAFLTEEKEALFKGFVDASVKAIEQRDPTTSGHSHRVARLCLKMADLVNMSDEPAFRNTRFNENQLKEIEYASLLHDFGKLGVREQVLLKAKKLYPWEMDLLLERFELIKSRYEVDFLAELVNYLQAPNMFPPGLDQQNFQDKFQSRVQQLEAFLDFILKANEPTVLEQGGFERLKDIANFNFNDSRRKDRPFLLSHELKALSVSRGSLTAEEFAEIQSHVTHTYEFLRKIPWGRNLANIPQIAAKHHEKLDGSGYPTAAAASEIPLQSRIMTISDIFDALTAADRPYKKAVPVEKALNIIEMEVKSGKCDPNLFKIFIESACYKIVL